MLAGMLGRKIGMAHLFSDEEGRVEPVTVLEVGPCIVTQLRTGLTDGYEAVQLGFRRAKALNKPTLGHLKQSGPLRHLREFKALRTSEYRVGQTVDVRQFQPGELVHVSGRSKGRGFTGVMKRHGFSGGPKTHGQGDHLRAPGSIGATTFPGRVFKGKRMAGHYGSDNTTVRNLRVMSVDPDRNLLTLRGAVPGARNGVVVVRHADIEAAARALAGEDRTVTSSPPADGDRS